MSIRNPDEYFGKELKAYDTADGSKSAVERLVMALRVNKLHKDHDVVRAARAMVYAHIDNETMVPALEDVREQFPDVPDDYLICLWIGINAKDREGLVEA